MEKVAYAMAQMLRSENNLQKLFLFFYHVESQGLNSDGQVW